MEYIVEHTLGPVFEERKATFEELMEQWLPKLEAYQKLDQQVRKGDRSERIHNKRKELNLEVETIGKRATEALMSIKVCDPAMGSGHFLKEATDKLAEKIITLLAEYPENPVSNLLEQVREQILESLHEQDISIDAEEHLKDTNLIKRMVMKRSIYGVDLNPMAVELAKLSLWLDSFTVGAPLSFLDHHLKVGNSLIGTTVGEIRGHLQTGQSHMFGGPFSGLLKATELMREVSVKTDATYSEVEQSIERYRDFEEAVKPYKQVLDIWLSRHFDNERAGDFLVTFSDQITHLLKGEELQLGDKQQTIIDKAEALEQQKHFFHWELEFPEVFVDLKQSKWLDNPGFDAVVGNPPYVTSRNVDIYKENKDYVDRNFEVGFYQIDLYYLFSELANQQTKDSGYWSFIIPDPWIGSVQGKNFRKWLSDKNTIEEIGIPKNKVFEADVDCLVLISKLPKKEDYETLITKIGNNSVKLLHKISLPRDGTEFPITGHGKIFNKLNSISIGLDEVSLTGRGIGAYHHSKHSKEIIESRAFHSSYKKDETYKPELGGEDVDRYMIRWSNDRWISYGDWLSEPRDPKLFKGPRLLCRKILSDKLCCTFTNEDWLVDQQVYVAAQFQNGYSPKYATAIIASRLISFYSKKKYHEEGLFPHLRVTQFRELPIREIDFSKFNAEKNTEYTDRLERLYQSYMEGQSEAGELLVLTEQLVSDEDEYRLPLIHDFLADLAEQMLELNEEKQRLEEALDPFKFLNKGVAFKAFNDVFSDTIKYGRQLTGDIDIGTVHHDIEALRLRPEAEHSPVDSLRRQNSGGQAESPGESEEASWIFSVQLKHRDPETGWDDWIKENGNIVRTTRDVFRLQLSDEEARYWQQAFEVLDEFENSSTIPGGKTRSTFEKLMKTHVPVFDDSANIEPLIELREELTEVNEKIEKTDWLIDRVVYQLYGLSEDEIEIVERSV